MASCVSQKQFKGLKTDYTKLQTEYQESQLQLRENQARSTSLEERLAEAQRNNSELRKSLSDMQSILNKSLTPVSYTHLDVYKRQQRGFTYPYMRQYSFGINLSF